MVDPKSMQGYARKRIDEKQLNAKEQELYDISFHLYKERGYGREYLRQLVTVACTDADKKRLDQ